MKLLAPVLACLILISMSPAAIEAFSQITGAEIISGVMDLDSAMSGNIYAIGKKDGLIWNIKCRWQNGVPECVYFENSAAIL